MTPFVGKVKSPHCIRLFRKLIVQPPYFNNVIYYKTESKNTKTNSFDAKKYVEDIKSIHKLNMTKSNHD